MSTSKNMLNVNTAVATVFLVVAAVCTSNEPQSKRLSSYDQEMEDLAFTEYDLFQTTVTIRSTYGATNGKSTTCSGHSVGRTLNESATSGPGMKTFNVRREQDEVNVALSKATSQSSTYDGSESARAVDGDSDPDYQRGSCSHTLLPADQPGGQPAWWQVDLGQSYCIQSVSVTPRADYGADRLQDFDIHVYALNPLTNPLVGASLCHHQAGPVDGGTGNFSCTPSPLAGRYVRVTNGGTFELTLCEVKVMALCSPY